MGPRVRDRIGDPFYRRRIARGDPTPWWDDRPADPPEWIAWVLDDFWELCTDRPVSVAGLAPLPGSVLREYVAFHGITERELFMRLIRALDSRYLAFYRRRDDSDGA